MRSSTNCNRGIHLKSSRPRVCVIGAGPSGIIAAKVLKERRIPFRCFEKGSDIGGLWRINNDSGTSAAYESLHINSSRQLMAFSDFPMKSTLPDFPHHAQILEYLEDFVAHHRLRESMTFQTAVTDVIPLPAGGYRVRTRSRRGQEHEQMFDAVVVGNGHHWSPKMPDFPGEFHGQQMHSHEFRSAKPFANKNVLVVGLGNSGVDIACELSRSAKRTVLSTRRGAHVIPKYLLGKPLDRVASKRFWTWCPFWLRQKLFAGLLKLTRGRQSRYGLPVPPYQVLQEHPTVSSELLNLLGHGKLSVKPDVAELQENKVRFSDQSSESFDTIIYATGYHIRFPFLDPKVLDTRENQVPLFKKVVHPYAPGLFFIGLVQPWGPVMPLAEAQAEWIADLMENKAMLPAPGQMERSIQSEALKMAKRYVKSTRHTIQVDFYPYLNDIQKQRQRRRGQAAIRYNEQVSEVNSIVPSKVA